jgi:hypothetical protein
VATTLWKRGGCCSGPWICLQSRRRVGIPNGEHVDGGGEVWQQPRGETYPENSAFGYPCHGGVYGGVDGHAFGLRGDG